MSRSLQKRIARAGHDLNTRVPGTGLDIQRAAGIRLGAREEWRGRDAPAAQGCGGAPHTG